MNAPQQRGGQAEAAILWAVHISGPDDVYAVEDQEIADAAVTMLNWSFRRQGLSDMCRAEVIDWPHGVESWEAQKGLFRLEALTSAPPAPSVGGWQDIASAPKDKTVLVGYWDSYGNWRTLRATYYRKGELPLSDDYPWDDESDGFAPEGWYEEVYTHETVMPLEQDPVMWHALPQPPKEKP